MRAIAYAISFVFHPLFMMTYMVVLLSATNPQLFGVSSIEGNGLFILQIFAYTFFLPMFATVMMKMLGFVSSLEMEDKAERIGPLIATTVLFMWISYNFYKTSEVPRAFTVFMVGATISLCIAFAINVVSKISLHAIGVGGLLGMVVITMLRFSDGYLEISGFGMSMNAVLMAVILICGLVCTARLLLEAHEPIDLYGGFFIGFGTQFVALSLLG